MSTCALCDKWIFSFLSQLSEKSKKIKEMKAHRYKQENVIQINFMHGKILIKHT